MHLAIDGNEANINNRVGSNIYAYNLLTQFNQLAPKDHFDIHLKNPPLPDLPPANPHWRYQVYGPRLAWTQWRLPLNLYLNTPKPQATFTPSHYAPRISPVPTTITIFDLAFHYFPETFQPRVLRQLKNWTRYSVNNAAHIFTISQHTKQDIVNLYGKNPDQITVAYPGSNLKSTPKANFPSIKVKHKIPDKYFLFIGTQQPRKNLTRLIQAINQLNQSANDPINLVVVGKTWHQFKPVKSHQSPHVIYTGYIPDQDLLSILKHAQALVFPSLYEGFGIPVLEAMKAGTLVAASNSSSIPEITDTHPLLFNPKSTKDITKTITKITHISDSKRKKLIQAGKIKAKQFSWHNCATTILEKLHRLTASSH